MNKKQTTIKKNCIKVLAFWASFAMISTALADRSNLEQLSTSESIIKVCKIFDRQDNVKFVNCRRIIWSSSSKITSTSLAGDKSSL
jgi:hypothetical protein